VINGDQGAFIDKTRCAEDGLAPTTNGNIHGQTDSAFGIFPNDISWLCQTENTPIWPQKGAECELREEGLPNNALHETSLFSHLLCHIPPSVPTN
jgi:hypothetical protein